MKKFLIIAALLVSAVSFSNAQGRGQQGTPEERAQRTLDGQAVASINLNADQKAKTLALLVRQNKSTDSLRTALNGDFQAMGPKMATIRESNEKLFISWLTPDQKKAYDAALAAAKQNNPNATGILGGGRGGR
jgi:hypothetical protein